MNFEHANYIIRAPEGNKPGAVQLVRCVSVRKKSITLLDLNSGRTGYQHIKLPLAEFKKRVMSRHGDDGTYMDLRGRKDEL